ncbi:ATP-grasp domain-containing protein [Candidatus Bathyarchaeota archaeon]|nr:ATP-grasp domain-containing protein [Candidatus Bathyarchaeota archaeon]
MRLLVYEHVSGGGFAAEAIPGSVLSEGFGMLRTLISDFKAAGHSVTATLDSRIARLNPPIDADCVVPVFSSLEAQANLRKISEQADAAYVIAPETDGVLQSLVELVEQTGTASLNCPAIAIEKVSDKVGVYEFMRKLGLPLPETIMFSVADDLKEVTKAVRGRLNFPVIFKPSDGVSCCGLSVVRNEEQVAGGVDKIKRESLSRHFLVQELIEGAAASVSLLSTGSEAVPISLNRQDVTIETPEVCSSYSGGLVPFDNPLRAEAFEVAERLVNSVLGLRGYVGVDFVLTEDEAVIIEVNPRLTTSYVGLRRVVNFNPAQAIVNAVLKRELPRHSKSCGCTYFSKVETPNPTVDALETTYRIDEIVSPPFPVIDNGAASALIASYGATLNEATSRFREAKKRVINTIDRGM